MNEQEKKYREALENIKKHMEIVSPTGYHMSGVWNIANNALKGDKR